ncbi:VOC family protein [Sulfitobacter donghicola]|uniref:Polyphosphate kinase n=1 Tax=Sulfitobacter donghicola DSW-25 = KCTC 12864 = JCM 14565 TaxID=1300350 RepID=A0A073IX17_9RHOB|nr:VOC family protein [Sulfitobacter donghicola]KEJ89922.1 polyphosphate kinase [Sulfitobacter donghicola DSW-25 = KCTC 12864 = JCM 14565]KIN66953.1 Glyoxalase 3 domain containing protein [Sulfitobacter donghicola DSW-25 = KCTC 12864 = JCM 14565]
MIEFDHIAVAGETLAAATTHVEKTLGVPLQTGGEHAVFHTHNTLLGLEEGLYLEAISINPDAPQADRPRWFDLDRFSGAARLTNWICRCDDLDETLSNLPDGFGQPVEIERGNLRWRMAVPASGVLPYDNCAPALIQWIGDEHPAPRLTQQGCRIVALEVYHPQATALAALLAPILFDARVSFAVGEPKLSARIQTQESTIDLC